MLCGRLRTPIVSWAVQIGKRIYVLHAFQKKSKKGIETPKREVDLIRQRYFGSTGVSA